MLEPQLSHHRATFDKLKRRQIVVVLAVPLCALVFAILVAILAPPEWVQWLAIPLLIGAMVAIVIMEVLKMIAFWRDVREREDRGSKI